MLYKKSNYSIAMVLGISFLSLISFTACDNGSSGSTDAKKDSADMKKEPVKKDTSKMATSAKDSMAPKMDSAKTRPIFPIGKNAPAKTN